MGHSGGRSSGNRKAQGAEERATPRQRDGIDPPGFGPGQHDPDPTWLDRAVWWVTDEVRDGTFWAAFLGAVIAIALCKLIGLI